jgi:hypothetical protein
LSIPAQPSSDARRTALAIAAMLVVVIVATSIGAAVVLRERTTEDWKRRLGNLALIVSENTAQIMTSAYLVLDSVSDDVRDAHPETEADLRRAFATEASYLALHNKISGVPQLVVASVIDAHGRLISSSRRFPPPTYAVADRE